MVRSAALLPRKKRSRLRRAVASAARQSLARGRLEAIRAAHAEAEAALRDRIGVLESGAGPFAALAARLAEIETRMETRIESALAGEDADSARLIGLLGEMNYELALDSFRDAALGW